jgi:hypothetical protein
VRALLALLSGLSVRPLMELGDSPYNLLITGGVFGALVLVPFLVATRARLARALALVIGAALVHWGAVTLAVYLAGHVPRVAVYALPGLVGALLCALLTVLVAPLRAAWRGVGLASMAGLVGGVAFGVTPDSDFWVWGDYILWQMLVLLGLHLGTRLTADEHRRVKPQAL